MVKEKKRYGELTNDVSDLHHELFNQDYYIIGYYQAERWLEDHGLSVFEAVRDVHDWEKMHIGETKCYDNAESLVNMLVYCYGGELLWEYEEEIWCEDNNQITAS